MILDRIKDIGGELAGVVEGIQCEVRAAKVKGIEFDLQPLLDDIDQLQNCLTNLYVYGVEIGLTENAPFVILNEADSDVSP